MPSDVAARSKLDADAEFAELVALVREHPDIELNVEPGIEQLVRFEALNPEQRVAALHECAESSGAIAYYKVEDGEVVRDLDAEQQERAFQAAWDELRRRESWRRALAARSGRLPRIARPRLISRIRARGRRRRATRRSAARSPGREPGEPPDIGPHPGRGVAA